MNLLEKHFRINFYNWSREYFDREIDLDFPVLRKFDTWDVFLFLRIFKSLSIEEQRNLERGLLKRGHSSVAESINQPETKALEKYFAISRRAVETGEKLSARSKIKGLAISRREMRKKVKIAIGNNLGTELLREAAGILRVSQNVGDMQVKTSINFGGFAGDLIYDQELLDKEGIRIKPCISVLSWLGISGGGTWWENITEEAFQPTIDALVFGCNEFIRAVPKLMQ